MHQRVEGTVPPEDEVSRRALSSLRAPWFEVSCCPTNLARLSSFTASNGGYVGRIDGTGDARTDSFVDFLVNVPTARAYTMTIKYANATGANATQGLAYNGGGFSTVTYPPTSSGWGNPTGSVDVTVQLKAGYNVIRLAKGSPNYVAGTGYAELDSIRLQ